MHTKTVMMPRELTAENGAKYSFSGEFYEEIELTCPEECEEPGSDCEICGGDGHYTQKVPVSWTTIKEIYAKAVKELGV